MTIFIQHALSGVAPLNASVSTLRVRLGYLCDEIWNRLADGVRLAGLPE